MIRLDEVPAPVARCTLRQGTPRLVETNDPFDDAFESGNGTTVRQWLAETFAVAEGQIDRLCADLSDGTRVDVVLSSSLGVQTETRYRVRSRAKSISESGFGRYLLVTAAAPSAAVDAERVSRVLAHDLRNPLDVASAHLQAARKTGAETHFEQVSQAHRRMERLIANVPTVTGETPSLGTTAEFDLESIVRDAWMSVETGEATLSLGSDLGTVEGDADTLQRLFENLFRNSVEHANPISGGQTVTDLQVDVGSIGKGFYVADDGSGIPPEERAHVFEAGWTGNASGIETGLGLAIVERITNAHGWSVRISESETGGTRFEFEPSTDEQETSNS